MQRGSWKVRLGTTALAVGMVVAVPATAASAAQSNTTDRPQRAVAAAVQPQQVVSFYRLFNPSSGDHFNTTSWTEVINALTYGGYHYEGVSATVSTAPGPGLTAFYRLFNPSSGDHFNTTSMAEVISAISGGGYQYEGVSAYVYPANSGTGIAFYRLFNPSSGDHFNTTSWTEVISAISGGGYRYEGVGANVLG